MDPLIYCLKRPFVWHQGTKNIVCEIYVTKITFSHNYVTASVVLRDLRVIGC